MLPAHFSQAEILVLAVAECNSLKNPRFEALWAWFGALEQGAGVAQWLRSYDLPKADADTVAVRLHTPEHDTRGRRFRHCVAAVIITYPLEWINLLLKPQCAAYS